VAAVREALEPDSGNFSGWDAGPARSPSWGRGPRPET
jgi:hypothetical protein